MAANAAARIAHGARSPGLVALRGVHAHGTWFRPTRDAWRRGYPVSVAGPWARPLDTPHVLRKS
jgi:hypothetical protein